MFLAILKHSVHQLYIFTYTRAGIVVEKCRKEKRNMETKSGGRDIYYAKYYGKGECRDEDPFLAKNRIRGSVPQTKGDF